MLRLEAAVAPALFSRNGARNGAEVSQPAPPWSSIAQQVAKRLSIDNLVVWLEPASSTFETILSILPAHAAMRLQSYRVSA